jgi:N-acetylglutamate synthase-like GNAT family acetyltransferase
MKLGTRTYNQASLKLGVPTALPAAMRKSVIEVRAVHTDPDYRGNGQATQLMLNTMLEADMNNRFLMLHVKPGEDCPLDQQKLAQWYLSLGFVPIQSEPETLMVRPCVGKVAA